jgi:hypothetical protein
MSKDRSKQEPNWDVLENNFPQYLSREYWVDQLVKYRIGFETDADMAKHLMPYDPDFMRPDFRDFVTKALKGIHKEEPTRKLALVTKRFYAENPDRLNILKKLLRSGVVPVRYVDRRRKRLVEENQANSVESAAEVT